MTNQRSQDVVNAMTRYQIINRIIMAKATHRPENITLEDVKAIEAIERWLRVIKGNILRR